MRNVEIRPRININCMMPTAGFNLKSPLLVYRLMLINTVYKR
jgi:hypothetical protein